MKEVMNVVAAAPAGVPAAGVGRAGHAPALPGRCSRRATGCWSWRPRSKACMGDTLDGVSIGPHQGRDADGRRLRSDAPADAGPRDRSPGRSQPLPDRIDTGRRFGAMRRSTALLCAACIAPLPRFLLRAPLLPVATLWRGPRALLRHPLGRDAVAAGEPVAGARDGRRPQGSRARALRPARRLPAHAARPAGGRVHGDARGSDGGRDGRTGRAPRAELGPHRSVRARAAGRSRAARANAAARRSVGAARRRRRPLARPRHGGGARRSARAERRPDRPARRSVRRSPRGGAGRAAARHPGGGASSGRPGTTCAPPRARTSKTNRTTSTSCC